MTDTPEGEGQSKRVPGGKHATYSVSQLPPPTAQVLVNARFLVVPYVGGQSRTPQEGQPATLVSSAALINKGSGVAPQGGEPCARINGLDKRAIRKLTRPEADGPRLAGRAVVWVASLVPHGTLVDCVMFDAELGYGLAQQQPGRPPTFRLHALPPHDEPTRPPEKAAPLGAAPPPQKRKRAPPSGAAPLQREGKLRSPSPCSSEDGLEAITRRAEDVSLQGAYGSIRPPPPKEARGPATAPTEVPPEAPPPQLAVATPAPSLPPPPTLPPPPQAPPPPAGGDLETAPPAARPRSLRSPQEQKQARDIAARHMAKGLQHLKTALLHLQALQTPDSLPAEMILGMCSRAQMLPHRLAAAVDFYYAGESVGGEPPSAAGCALQITQETFAWLAAKASGAPH